MRRDEWLALGVKSGWCGPPVCSTHDGIPTTADEDDWLDDGDGDPCIHIIRPYLDDDEKRAVEENHAPSVWRRTNAEAVTNALL